MEPTHRNTQVASASATSLTIAKPTGLQVGDQMLLWFTLKYATVLTVTPPSGFVAVQGTQDFETNILLTGIARSYLFTKRADAADVAASDFTVTISGATSYFLHGVLSAYEGVDASSPIIACDYAATTTASTAPSIGSIYAQLPGAGLCWFLWVDVATSGGSLTGPGSMPGSSMTEIVEDQYVAGASTAFLASGTATSKALPHLNTGTIGMTLADSARRTGCLVALRPASEAQRRYVTQSLPYPSAAGLGYGFVQCVSTTYADARSGAGTKNAYTMTASSYNLRHGQKEASGTYTCTEGFCQLDTTGLSEDDIDELFLLRFAAYAYSVIMIGEVSGVSELRLLDWGTGNPTTADFVGGDDLDALPLLATADWSSGVSAYGFANYVTAPGAIAAFKAAVNAGGVTRFILCSRDHRLGVAPPVGATEQMVPYSNGIWMQAQTHQDSRFCPVAVGLAKPVSTVCAATASTWWAPVFAEPGDLMLATWSTTASDITAAPDGWTLLAADNTNSVRVAWAYKWAEESDFSGSWDGVYAFNPTSTHYSGQAVSFANVLPDNPIGAHPNQYNSSSSNTATSPTLTQTQSDTLIVLDLLGYSGFGALYGFAIANGDPGASAWNVLANVYGGGTDEQIAIVAARRTAKTATGVGTATGESVAGISWGMTIELNGLPSAELTNPAISINSGAASTTDGDVTLSLSCDGSTDGNPADVEEMCFSEDGTTWSAWEDYATSRAFSITPDALGSRSVYVKYRLMYADEWFESDAANDSINVVYAWDCDLLINDGDAVTYLEDVTLSISAVDTWGDTPTHMRFSEDESTWTNWELFAATKAFTLSTQTTFPTENYTVFCEVR